MKTNIFLFWYYSKGLIGLFGVWRNFFVFFWKYFSVKDLLLTLFSPWKKDVSLHTWRGFQLKKTMEALADNLFSRFVGAAVRFVVILLGLITELMWLVLLPFSAFLWFLAWPVGIILIFFLATGYFFNGILFVVICDLLLLIFAYAGYRVLVKNDYKSMSLEELYESVVFKRVCDRFNKFQLRFGFAKRIPKLQGN